jgi:hypothetical protein
MNVVNDNVALSHIFEDPYANSIEGNVMKI